MIASIDGWIEDLLATPLFSGVSCEECRGLLEIAEPARFGGGEFVLRQGDSNRRLWLLLDGECEVLRQDGSNGPSGEPLLLATLSPVSTIGEMSFFQSAPHSASVRTKNAVHLLYIAPESFAEFRASRPEVACKLAINLVSSLAERLRSMDRWVAELATQTKAAKRVPELSLLREKLFQDWNV